MNNKELVNKALLKAASKNVEIDEAYIHDPSSMLRNLNRSKTTTYTSGSYVSGSYESKENFHPEKTYHHNSKDSVRERKLELDKDAADHNAKLSDLQYAGQRYTTSWSKQAHHGPLYNYTTTAGARRINAHLINAHSPGTMDDHDYEGVGYDVRENEVKALTNHINKHAMPLPEDGHFYSGTKIDMKKVAASGNTFHMPAFTSTSTHIGTAAGFKGIHNVIDDSHYNIDANHHVDQNSYKVHDSHIIHFKLPKGYKKGIAISPVSSFSDEHEFLLDKGQNWKITGHQRVNQTDFRKESTINSETNVVSRKLNTKSVNRIHIWTVEPLEHHNGNIHEAYIHDPKAVLRSITRSHSSVKNDSWVHHFDKSRKKTTITESSYHDPSLLRKVVRVKDDWSDYLKYKNDKYVKDTEKQHEYNSDINAQHERLSVNQYGLKHSSPVTRIKNRRKHHVVTQYTSNSTDINRAVIGGASHKYDPQDKNWEPLHYNLDSTQKQTYYKKANELQAHLSSHSKPLPEDVHAYSGVAFNMHKIHESGGVFTTPAFTSSSLNIHTASNFARSNDIKPKSESHIIHFHLPKGYNKAMYVEPITNVTEENELILHKGQRWKIVGHQRVKRTIFKDIRDGQRIVEKTKDIHHMNIWTVVPHNVPETKAKLDEAVNHNPNVIRSSSSDTTTVTGSYKAPKYKSTFNNELSTAQKEENHLQHTRLTINQFGSEAPDRYEYKFGKHADETEHIIKYTDSSRLLNNHILLKSKKHNYVRDLDNFKDVAKYHKKSYGGYATDGELNHRIRHISNYIKKNGKPLPENVHTYSGVTIDMEKIHKNGGVFKTPAFTSSSLSLEKASGFGGLHNQQYSDPSPPTVNGNQTITKTTESREKHIIHFKLPKGYKKGIYIAPISDHAGEQEYLLDRDQHWKITGHQLINNADYSTRHYNNDTYKSKVLTKVHIWTVEPHNPKKKVKPVTEAYVHDISNSTVNNVENTHAARLMLSPFHKAEHETLSKLHDHITEDHKTQVRRFTGMSFELNQSLANDKPPHPLWKDVHEHLQNMFNKSPSLNHEHHVYSGLGNFDPSKHFAHSNGVFKIKSYISTSIDPSVAIAHTNLKNMYDGYPSEDHIIHFKLPLGYRGGHYIANHSAFKGEHEMILNHGQKFKLIGHKQYNIGNKVRHIWSVEPHE